MKTVHVNLDERSYDIAIGRELAIGTCLDASPGACVLVVTDTNVGPKFLDRVSRDLTARGLRPVTVTVEAGEGSKSLSVLGEIWETAVDAGLDRKSFVLALGGGMVGDLAGFAAATLFRGVKLIQVPTSLLAMVDSSVGGKTAVNLPQGKNLVGAFHQPVEVCADLDMLATLPEREYLSGLGEVVKYGIIWDASLFREFERSVDALVSRDPVCLEEIVARCCEIKAEVVAMDECEAGVRAILNYGHTLAHALERGGGYGDWLHGEAVSVGMVYAGEVSVREKKFPADEQARVRALLVSLGLPVTPQARGARIPWDEIRKGMATDKKTRGGIPRFVLAESLGSVVFGCEVSEDTLRSTYGSMGPEAVVS